MRRIFRGILLALGTIFVTAGAYAASGNSNKLLCFDGPTESGGIYGGTCSIADGIATLDNTDGNLNGSYSGVYITGTNLAGKLLTNVGQLSFVYTGVPGAGAPRVSLPLDVDGDGTTDVYAFISAFYCNNGAGLVDAIHDPTCTIYVGADPSSYGNWPAFVAAYPTATVGPDGNLAFVIADEAGLWTVSDVRLGKASRTTGK